jgi:biopolymer transport protein ExbD
MASIGKVLWGSKKRHLKNSPSGMLRMDTRWNHIEERLREIIPSRSGFCVVCVSFAIRILSSLSCGAADTTAPGAETPAPRPESNFPYAINFVAFKPQWSHFASGDAISITGLRGDRKHIEPNGRYLIEGDYLLHSMERAKLGLRAGDERHAPVDIGDVTEITQGIGHFSVASSLSNVGPFPIFFSAIGGGAAHGTVYVSEIAPPISDEIPTTAERETLLIGINNDGWLSVRDKFVKGDELQPLLATAHEKDSGIRVLIKPYNLVGMDKVKFVMDSCHAAGITEVSLEYLNVIGFDAEGAISFNHEPVSDDRLAALLGHLHKVDPDSQILIEFYEETPIKRLKFATDSCRGAKLFNFNVQDH